MPKVVTFMADLRIFKTVGQLKELDEQVNNFIKENNITTIYSMSDTTTHDNTGATIGIIRVMAYE